MNKTPNNINVPIKIEVLDGIKLSDLVESTSDNDVMTQIKGFKNYQQGLGKKITQPAEVKKRISTYNTKVALFKKNLTKLDELWLKICQQRIEMRYKKLQNEQDLIADSINDKKKQDKIDKQFREDMELQAAAQVLDKPEQKAASPEHMAEIARLTEQLRISQVQLAHHNKSQPATPSALVPSPMPPQTTYLAPTMAQLPPQGTQPTTTQPATRGRPPGSGKKKKKGKGGDQKDTLDQTAVVAREGDLVGRLKGGYPVSCVCEDEEGYPRCWGASGECVCGFALRDQQEGYQRPAPMVTEECKQTVGEFRAEYDLRKWAAQHLIGYNPNTYILSDLKAIYASLYESNQATDQPMETASLNFQPSPPNINNRIMKF
jgi:hypothetical protein